MSDKLTQKQENFCLVYVETGNASEAYRQAYDAEKSSPKTIHEEACRVLADPKVSAKVFKLQEANREAHQVTVESLCVELDETRVLAHDIGQAGAAVTATMGKAKLYGLLVDQRNTNLSGTLTINEADEILREVGLLDE